MKISDLLVKYPQLESVERHYDTDIITGKDSEGLIYEVGRIENKMLYYHEPVIMHKTCAVASVIDDMVDSLDLDLKDK